MVGGYGLELNFGSRSQPPIPPPNTVVAQQPDQGGGSINAPQGLGGSLPSSLNSLGLVQIGNLVDWGEALTAKLPAPFSTPAANGLAASQATGSLFIGVVDSSDHDSNADSMPQPFALGASVSVNPLMTDSGSVAVLGSTPTALQALDNVLASWNVRDHLS
jgi:hypothetical protein